MTRFLPAIALCAPLAVSSAATAQSSASIFTLPEPPMLSFAAIGRITALSSSDVREIEIASSDNSTDVFIRFFPSAAEDLANWTSLAEGFAMSIAICGATLLEVESLSPMVTGTLYIPNLTFVQADALRSIWHGREACSTLPSEVFPIGQ